VKNLVDFILRKKETKSEFNVNVAAKSIFGSKADGVMNVKNAEAEFRYVAER
jgi:hypothetical protein